MQHLKLSATAVAATIMAIASSAHAQAVPAPGTPLPAAPGAAAQPAAAAPALPNQQGVVYPGRTYQPSAVVVQQQPVTAMPGIPGPPPAAAPQAIVVTPLPGQAPINPAAVNYNPNPLTPAQRAQAQAQAIGTPQPNLPPIEGGVAVPVKAAAKKKTKSPQALAVDDTIPEGMDTQIRELRRRMVDVERATVTSPMGLPKPVTRSIQVTQAPGEEPPAIRTTMGVPTSLVFTDASGAPWPIDFAIPGDTTKFDVLLPVAGTSSIQIRPRSEFSYGGMSITLKNNPVPLSIVLSAAQKEVDNRVDVRVMSRGPNAVAPVIDRSTAQGSSLSDAFLSQFLDGVAPSGAQVVKTSNAGIQAWAFNQRLYLRTNYTLASPYWSDSVTSPNGVARVYVIPSVPSVVVSIDGQMTRVAIDE